MLAKRALTPISGICVHLKNAAISATLKHTRRPTRPPALPSDSLHSPMLQPELLNVLRCPDDHSRLSPASDETVRRINAAVREGRLTNRAGKQPDGQLDGGLVREDGAFIYPIIDGIPVLLRDDAIALDQLGE